MNSDDYRQQNEASLVIRLMEEQDAPGVVELYRAVYGDEYPVKTVYDPESIIRQQQNGDMLRILALSGPKVVGQVALYRSSSPNRMLYEEGQGIVLADYRKRGIIQQCMNCGHLEVYPRLQIEQIWGEAVCNHTFMQKVCAHLDYCETGLELDLMPASSYAKEQSSKGRVSTLLVFKTYKARARTVYLPEHYEDSLRYLYTVCNFGHNFLPARDPLPPSATLGKEEIFEGAGVARFTLPAPGADLHDYLVRQERAALDKNCSIFQVYMSLASSSMGAAVDVLRKHGYFLGGILPRWFDEDGLLMQKLLHEPDAQNIQLHSDRAARMLEMILADRKSVCHK